jgi:arginyl-tRNA synthetase
VKATLQALIHRALADLQAEGALPPGDLPAISLERPKQESHGDFATNAAMVLGGRARKKPREVAQALVTKIGDGGGAISRTEIAGPGFINFFISEQAWQAALGEILEAGERFGRVDLGHGRRVNLEFVSANPTGPLHVGHGRQAAVGDALARLLDAAGYDVQREYYINDAGNQVQILGRSVYARYRELCGLTFEFPEDGYPGEYVREIAAELREREGDRLASVPEAEAVDTCGRHAAEVLLRGIQADLERFDVRFHRWFSERTLVESGEVQEALDRLRATGRVYERDGALWFQSEAFGDEKDRVVVKADGLRTYFATDIAYHYDKFQRGFDWCIDIWGADHHGYIPRVKAAIGALGHDPDKFSVLLVQFVNLIGGRMGKRSGNLVTLRDLLGEVGSDAARFFYLLRSHNNALDFDLRLAKEETPENPVFYVQYGHARICQLLERARQDGHPLPSFSPEAVAALRLPEELAIVRNALAFPEVVAIAATELEPHRIAFYLQELIGLFHSYYTKYKHTERVVSADPAKTRARLLMCEALRMVIRNGLALLGVSAPSRMEAPAGEEP